MQNGVEISMLTVEPELKCPVCHEIFTEPIMLQCSHHLCAQHVQNFSSRERFSCPVCNDVAAVPEGGMKVDMVLKLVVETYKLQQASSVKKSEVGRLDDHDQETSPVKALTLPKCGICEDKPASRQCLQCDGVLCEDCEKSTHAKGFFQSHVIKDLGEETDGVDFASRMVCQEHSEKLDFYCLDCRTPVCSHCLILGDHKNHQQTPLDQAYVTGKDTLAAWADKLHQRISATEELLESFRSSEQDIQRNAESQRQSVNSEMDHLRELIETKRHQLLSKCALEEKQKRVQLQAQMDRADVTRGEARSLVVRSEGLLSLGSEHVFLSVVLPLIQDMKKCASRPVDDNQRVSTAFRPISTDSQVRCLGDLDLGHSRPLPTHMGLAHPVLAAPSTAGLHQSQLPGVAHAVASASLENSQAFSVMHQAQAHYGSSAAMPYVQGQPGVHQQQVQYVYHRPAQ